MSFKAFDLSVLETYRNNPQYDYETDDIHGSISVATDGMASKDKVFLQTFGFCYDEKMNRAVAVFLRYLISLSPEHQRVWHTKMLGNGFKLHPDYYRTSILGDFPERVSIFDAFLEEIKQMNLMSGIIGKPNLFRFNQYEAYRRPEHFGFLIRPTLKEYQDFAHLLDKLISDNLNRDFFSPDIAVHETVTKADGSQASLPKGTITLLEEWLKRVTFPDPKPKADMLKTFRSIRTLRERPAHALDDNKFDQKYFQDQRTLIRDAYNAIRTLRLILENHPKLKSFEVPDWLREGEIWSY